MAEREARASAHDRLLIVVRSDLKIKTNSINDHVVLRITQGGVRYQATWTDDQGQECVRTFTRKTDADQHIRVMEGAKATGQYVDTSSKITVSEYARDWLTTRPHRASTQFASSP